MLTTLVRKFSSFLYRVHRYLDRNFKEKSRFTPYQLNYQPSGSPHKIIHVNGNFVIGGSTQLIVDLIERTSDRYTHQVIVPEHPDPLPYQPVPIRCFDLNKLTALRDHLASEKPSLVHIHYWVRHAHRYRDFALWYQAIFNMCSELGLKVIQNINVPTSPLHNPAVAHNVFVSNYVKDEFNDTMVPASVIYPGSDFSHFSKPGNHSLPTNTIGMVYRLDTDKLNAEAIEVFIEAVKRKPSLHCLIVGGGYYLRQYKKRVKEEKQTGNFTFTGVVSYKDLPAYYEKIGLFITPVHDESFGQVTPFAMSMGVPVAGYKTGALNEILGSSDTLVDYGNISALADLIVQLTNDPQRMQLLGQQNKERAHRLFSVETMIGEYTKLYDRLLA